MSDTQPIRTNPDYNEQIKTLKVMIVQESDLHQIARYFFDTLGHNRKFISDAKPVKPRLLRKILDASASRVFGEGSTVTGVRLLRSGRVPLVHGGCTVAGYPGTVLFFEDLNVGMLIVLTSLVTHHISCIRFNTLAIEGDKAAFFTGADNTSIH